MSEAFINHIKEKKIIAICRGIYGDTLLALARALARGGVSLIEVTYDQSDADCLKKTPDAIALLRSACPEMSVGAGTVLSGAQLRATIDAGGRFIISPNTDIELIGETKKAGLVSIPGAMTPSEIAQAYHAGADFVKLFPCANLGTAYVKSITSPLNHIPLLATGGIDAGNLEDYLRLGMAGAGIGGKLCDKKLLAEGRFDLIESNARACAEIAARY